MVWAGPGQGPSDNGAQNLYTRPPHDWPLWTRGPMGCSLPSQSGALGSPFIHKNQAGRGARRGPKPRGTLKHPRIPWSRSKSPEGPDRRKLDVCRDSCFPVDSFGPATRCSEHSSRAPSLRAPSPAPLGHACSLAARSLSATQHRGMQRRGGFPAAVCGHEVLSGGPQAAASATCALSVAPPTISSLPAGHSRQSSSSLLSEQSSSSSHLHTEGMQRSFRHRNWSSSHSLTGPARGKGGVSRIRGHTEGSTGVKERR